MYVGMSEVHRERDNLHAATRHLLTSQELGGAYGIAGKTTSAAVHGSDTPG